MLFFIFSGIRHGSVKVNVPWIRWMKINNVINNNYNNIHMKKYNERLKKHIATFLLCEICYKTTRVWKASTDIS